MSAHRDRAVALLVNYFEAIARRAGMPWDADYTAEIGEAVDAILEAPDARLDAIEERLDLLERARVICQDCGEPHVVTYWNPTIRRSLCWTCRTKAEQRDVETCGACGDPVDEHGYCRNASCEGSWEFQERASGLSDAEREGLD